ncbi:hypothetical protein ACP70R_038741 [Stipagrostis hirtigluma subsp. patula]
MAEAAAKPMPQADATTPTPGARLLPLLEEDLRADVPDMDRADGGGPGARPRGPPDARRRVRLLRGAPHHVVRQLEGNGLVNLHSNQWALHRRVLTSAFYPDNLNVRARRAVSPFPRVPLTIPAGAKQPIPSARKRLHRLAPAGREMETDACSLRIEDDDDET